MQEMARPVRTKGSLMINDTCSFLVIGYGMLLIGNTENGLYIKQADPRVLITCEMLDEFKNGNIHKDVTLADEILTINGMNRRVVYKLGKYNHSLNAYDLEWPD